jgi:hypothetical protein
MIDAMVAEIEAGGAFQIVDAAELPPDARCEACGEPVSPRDTAARPHNSDK